MTVTVFDRQREIPVNTQQVARLAQFAICRLKIRLSGRLEIIFLDTTEMRRLNQRFLGCNRVTDVLSFCYETETSRARSRNQTSGVTVGEIFVAPRLAHIYARKHGLCAAQELSRYVLHGILHWLGHHDETPIQKRKMHNMENRLLAQCGMPNGKAKAEKTVRSKGNDAQHPRPRTPL